jgi:hypothetical protein
VVVQDFLEKTFAGDFDEVSGLQYVNTIEFGQRAEIVERYLQLRTDLSDNFLGDGGVAARYSKAVDLTKKKDFLIVYRFLVDAFFVRGRLEA